MRFFIICIYIALSTITSFAQTANEWGDGDNLEGDIEYTKNRRRLVDLASRYRMTPLCAVYADSIYVEAESRNDRKGCAMALTSKAMGHIFRVQDLDSMRFWTDSVKSYSKQHNLPRYYYFIWSQYIGVLLDTDFNKQEVKAEIDKMLSEAIDDHYIVGQIECYRRLAHFYEFFGLYEKEYEMRVREIELTEKYDPHNRNLSNYYAETARACIELGKYDEAEMYLNKGDKVTDNEISVIQLLNTRVDLAVKKDDKNEVLRLAQKAQHVGDVDRYKQRTEIDMYAYIYTGEYRKADSLSEWLYNHNFISEVTHLSNKLLIAKKDTTLSYYKHNIDDLYRYQAVTDSMALIRINLLMDDSDLKLKLAVLETEKNNIQIKAETLKFQIMFLFGIFSLIFVGILVYYTTRLRKTNASLQEKQSALIHQKEIAEQANEMKAEVIRNMSHEIRTPLNAVVGFSEVLSQLADKNVREQVELSNKIQDSTKELLDILNSVIDTSDLETNLSLDANDSIPINIFCSNLISKYDKQKHSVSTRFYPLEDECFIKTNERCLRIAVDALLSNAYKFTSNGYVEIAILRKDNDIRIEVIDTGCGISETQISKIFDRFYKGDIYTQGIGLGLPLCKLALNKIGATIEISANKNITGTYAMITLPNSCINMG